MKHFWRAMNVSLIVFCAWSGYWAVAPERLNDHGFIRSVVPVGPNYAPISFSSAVVFVMFGISSFVAFRRACLKGSSFYLPSWDRNPFREVGDPLQALVISLIGLVSGTVAATLRFLFGSSLGLGAILFLCAWDIGLLLGAVIGYVIYRPRIVAV